MGRNSWSASKLNVANYCTFKFYLRYVLHKETLRLSAYVKGSLLHELIEKFWDRLGTVDEAESTSKRFKDKKYYDAKSFAEYGKGLWKRIIVADEKAENKISWNSEGQPWQILNQFEKILTPLYYSLEERGRPLFSEMKFKFVVNNKIFDGRIDEIRKEGDKIRVIDYKSGSPWVGEMKLKHDPQLTMYNAAICAKLRTEQEFARKFDLEGRVEEFMEGRKFISPKIEQGFFMIEAMSINPEKVKNIPNPLTITYRDDSHFFEILKMVEGTEKSIKNGSFFPEYGRKCDLCDLKHACDEESKKIGQGYLADKKGNLYLPFAVPDYIKKVMEQENPNQKKFRFRYKELNE